MSKLKTQALDQLTTAFGLDPGMQEAARTALEDASEEEIKADLETLQHLKVRSHQLAQRAREKRLAPEPSTFSVWMRTVVLPDLATLALGSQGIARVRSSIDSRRNAAGGGWRTGSCCQLCRSADYPSVGLHIPAGRPVGLE